MEMMLLPLKRYFDFSGRSRRMEFWMFILFQFIVNMVFAVVVMAAGGAALMAAGSDVQSLAAAGSVVVVLYAINALFALALFIPNIAVSIRRLHDTNRTGWWILAPIGPYILSLVFIGMAFAVPDLAIVAGIVSAVSMLAFLGLGIMLLVFYFLDGTPGPNRFGHDPKQRGYEHTFA